MEFAYLLLILCAVLGAIDFGYSFSGRSPELARLARWQYLFIGSAAAGIGLTFFGAALARPLQDAVLASIDHALGFNWATANAWVRFHPFVYYPLLVAYFSLTPQTFASIFYFSVKDQNDRNRELWIGMCLGLTVTIVLFTFYPSLGPGARLSGPEFEYARILSDVRTHGLSAARFDSYGFIAFPSFHTIMCLLLIRAHRGTPLFLPVLALDILMLVAICPIGNHYLIDLLAGLMIAVAVMCVQSSLLTPQRWMGRL